MVFLDEHKASVLKNPSVFKFAVNFLKQVGMINIMFSVKVLVT